MRVEPIGVIPKKSCYVALKCDDIQRDAIADMQSNLFVSKAEFVCIYC
jgi:hypothetical protein